MDIIEFEVPLTHDGGLIVAHDARVNRISDGTGGRFGLRRGFSNSIEHFLPLGQTLDFVPAQMHLDVHLKASDVEAHPVYADDEVAMRRLIDCSVDRVLTNYPRQLQSLLAAMDL